MPRTKLAAVRRRGDRPVGVPSTRGGSNTSESSMTYTILEASRVLDVSESTVKRMIKSGELRSVLARRRRLIPKQAIHEFLAQ